MFLLHYFQQMWSWLFKRAPGSAKPRCDGVVHLIPEYEFVPTPAFLAFAGADACFVVSNTLDLVLQHQGLMTDMLVVEIHRPGSLASTLWFRYNTADLAAHGTAKCVLFAGCDDRIFDGVCGQLRDRKRM